jgi:hypothetical protein
MKTLKNTMVLMLGFCLLFLVARADVFDDIAIALRSGNAREVAKYFDANVELKTLDKSNNYSKNQAELVLKEFLDSYKTKSFNIVHRGSSAKGAQYSIGTMETAKGSFRVYIYMKDVKGKLYIQELSFEKQ